MTVQTTSVQITVHGLQSNGHCSLSGKEGEVLVLTFSDGTVKEAPLSAKSLLQLLRMKFAAPKQPKPAPVAAPLASPANGPAVAAPK